MLQNSRLETLLGLGGTPGGLRGTPPDLKVSNFDENITEMLQKMQKYTRKCYRKSTVVAPLHTHTKQKQNQIHTKLLQKIRGSGPLTHGQEGEIYNGTSTNITLSSTKNTVGQEPRTNITV